MITDSRRRTWQGWRGRMGDKATDNVYSRRSVTSRPRPHAMAGSPVESGVHQTSLGPVPQERSNFLWDTFVKRVAPFMRILFSWSLLELRTKSARNDPQASLSGTEIALEMAIYYVATNTLLDEECQQATGLSQASLLSEHQARCENALSSLNLLCITDFTTIKAIVFYVVCFTCTSYNASLTSIDGERGPP